jgi:hypothetical protein
MSILPGLGLGRLRPTRDDSIPVVQIVLSHRQLVLGRVLRFTRYSIHDVINDPIARNVVKHYYLVSRCIDRYCEKPIALPQPDHVFL